MMDKIFAITYKFPLVFSNIYLGCQIKTLNDFKSAYRDQDTSPWADITKDFLIMLSSKRKHNNCWKEIK